VFIQQGRACITRSASSPSRHAQIGVRKQTPKSLFRSTHVLSSLRLCLSQHSLQGRFHHFRPILAGGKSFQLVLLVKQVIGGHISFFILEHVAQLVLVVDGLGFSNSVFTNCFAHRIHFGVGWITWH